MQGDPLVIGLLQAQLKNELTAINQYFVHYRMFKHWGFERMAKKEYEESIGEMKHADRLMERIFVLEGLPNLQDLGKLLIGESVPEMLDCDLQSERGAQVTLKEAIVLRLPLLGFRVAIDDFFDQIERALVAAGWTRKPPGRHTVRAL